jgi:IstB-like ATP binding protein
MRTAGRALRAQERHYDFKLKFSQWDQIFKDPMTAAATIDRVVHHSVVLDFNGPSIRTEEAQRRQAEVDKQARDQRSRRSPPQTEE